MPKKATAKRPDAGAPCPIMHSCGGCAWLGLPYRKQLARKHTAMRELFEPLIAQFDGMRRSSRCSVWDLRAKAGP